MKRAKLAIPLQELTDLVREPFKHTLSPGEAFDVSVIHVYTGYSDDTKDTVYVVLAGDDLDVAEAEDNAEAPIIEEIRPDLKLLPDYYQEEV